MRFLPVPDRRHMFEKDPALEHNVEGRFRKERAWGVEPRSSVLHRYVPTVTCSPEQGRPLRG